MISREGSRLLIPPVAVAGLIAFGASPALAGEKAPKPTDSTPGSPVPPSIEQPEPPDPADAKLSVRVKGAGNGKLTVGSRVRILGKLHPWRPGQRVTVKLQRGKRTIKRKVTAVKSSKRSGGRFKVKGPKLVEPARYVATAEHAANDVLERASARSRRFKIKYPSLGVGSRSSEVRLFNRLLARQGYVPSRGAAFTGRTARAVLAFRKVNRMARISRASSPIFKRLADGRGTYKLKHPGAGRHVEASISRQVLVLADNGKAKRIYPTSSGAPGTPSDRGKYRFYRRQPGYNTLRMYYSVYYNRGEAIHGYHSVPTFPASHGCLRLPISDAVSIYNWVSLGMAIYVY